MFCAERLLGIASEIEIEEKKGKGMKNEREKRVSQRICSSSPYSYRV